MHKRLLTVCLFAFTLLLSSCNKDAELTSVMNDLDSFTKEIVKRGEGGSLEDAQKYFDDHKEEMKSKIVSVKDIREFQVSKETMSKVTEMVKKDAEAIGDMHLKLMEKAMADEAFNAKLTKLQNDYETLIQSFGKE